MIILVCTAIFLAVAGYVVMVAILLYQLVKLVIEICRADDESLAILGGWLLRN